MSLLDRIPWQNVQHLWIDIELRYQWVSIFIIHWLTTLLSTLLIRLSKKKFINEITDSKYSIWKRNLIRLITPSVFLVFTILVLSIFRSLNLGTEDFIKPAFNISVAWVIYRLVGIFTTNRAWLRTIAILLFGLASLQSFGVLSVTIELLEMISFQFGERKSPSSI